MWEQYKYRTEALAQARYRAANARCRIVPVAPPAAMPSFFAALRNTVSDTPLLDADVGAIDKIVPHSVRLYKEEFEKINDEMDRANAPSESHSEKGGEKPGGKSGRDLDTSPGRDADPKVH